MQLTPCCLGCRLPQLSLLGLQLFWTHDAEIALEKSRTDRTIMASINKKFQEVLSHLVDITTQDLSKSERTKIETLITIHIHQVRFNFFASLPLMFSLCSSMLVYLCCLASFSLTVCTCTLIPLSGWHSV